MDGEDKSQEATTGRTGARACAAAHHMLRKDTPWKANCGPICHLLPSSPLASNECIHKKDADLPGLGASCGSNISSSPRSLRAASNLCSGNCFRCSDQTLRPRAPSASQLGEQGTGAECSLEVFTYRYGRAVRPGLPPPQDAQRDPSPPGAARSPNSQSPHLARNHSGRGQGRSVTQNAQWEWQQWLGDRVMSLKPRPPLLDAPRTGGALSGR